MSGYPGGHAVFLVVALATHAVVGYTLGTVLFDRPAAGLIGGIVADVDLLVPDALGFPFAHRSATHSALALGLAAAVATRRDRASAGAVAAGYASQLLVDATTPMGIPLLYPFSETFVGIDMGLGGHSAPVTALLWLACLLALWGVRDAPVIPDFGRE